MLEDQEDVNHLESSDQNQEIEQQQSSEESTEGEVVQQEAAAQEEKQLPFHEHPRFKELVEQKNQFKQQFEMSSRQLQEMQRQLEEFKRSQEASRPKPQDALMERLKGIDPEFAEKFGKINEVDTLKSELQELKQFREEQAAQARTARVQSNMDKLFTENKISAEMRDIYEAQIAREAQKNPNIGIDDLPNVFKNVHEKMSKLLESTKRETTKNYVVNKQSAAAKPLAQPKGKAAPNGKPQQYSKNPEEARAQLVQNILKQTKAEKDI